MTEMNLKILGLISSKAVSETGEVLKDFQEELGALMSKYACYYIQAMLTPKEKKPEQEKPIDNSRTLGLDDK